MPEPAADRSDLAGLTRTLTGFARELRAAGLTAGTGDALAFCQAAAVLDPSDLADLYWSGRATLITRRDDIAVYDEVFRRYFLGGAGPRRDLITIRASVDAAGATALVAPATDPGRGGREEEDQAVLGLLAASAERLRHKSFAACTPAELAALRRIMATIRLAPPRRRSRRSHPARSGRSPDLRAMVRQSLRQHGEPPPLAWRRRRTRPRPLILILDISGSMAGYSRALLQFAHSAGRAAPRVEVFCFGTRLTRITPQLRTRRPDDALARATRVAFDWDGGTRIGESLDAFARDWGRRGISRGGLVLICSDGLDRGDPAVLAAAMERLSRLCRAIVWLNPHHGGDPSFRPSTVGMIAAAPYIDLLASGHDLASLEELAGRLRPLRLFIYPENDALRREDQLIRLGSLAGYPFEGPRLLAGWTAPPVAAVYAVLYQPDPDRKPGQYAPLFVAHADDLSAQGLPFRHPRSACWTRRSGSKWKLWICAYQVPGDTAAQREQITRELISLYHPGCNDERYDPTWHPTWIGRADSRLAGRAGSLTDDLSLTEGDLT